MTFIRYTHNKKQEGIVHIVETLRDSVDSIFLGHSRTVCGIGFVYARDPHHSAGWHAESVENIPTCIWCVGGKPRR